MDRLSYSLGRGPNSVKVVYLDFLVDYEYEYIGCNPRLVCNPQFGICCSTLLLSIRNFQSVALVGESGTGKTQTVKDLSQHMGKLCILVPCNQWVSHKTLSHIFIGVAQTGVV